MSDLTLLSTVGKRSIRVKILTRSVWHLYFTFTPRCTRIYSLDFISRNLLEISRSMNLANFRNGRLFCPNSSHCKTVMVAPYVHLHCGSLKKWMIESSLVTARRWTGLRGKVSNWLMWEARSDDDYRWQQPHLDNRHHHFSNSNMNKEESSVLILKDDIRVS